MRAHQHYLGLLFLVICLIYSVSFIRPTWANACFPERLVRRDLFPGAVKAEFNGKEGIFPRAELKANLPLGYRAIRVRPTIDGNTAQVAWVSWSDIWGFLGLQKGDLIHSINEVPIRDYQSFKDVFDSLIEGGHIEFKITRGETFGTLRYVVQK